METVVAGVLLLGMVWIAWRAVMILFGFAGLDGFFESEWYQSDYIVSDNFVIVMRTFSYPNPFTAYALGNWQVYVGAVLPN
jgi:subtilase family serine protease